MTFRVGQRVVCVADRKYYLNDLGLPGFVKGRVYTITSFYEEEPYGLFICVAELDQRVGGQICGFRPIVERKTSIEVFQRMLNPSEVEA